MSFLPQLQAILVAMETSLASVNATAQAIIEHRSGNGDVATLKNYVNDVRANIATFRAEGRQLQALIGPSLAKTQITAMLGSPAFTACAHIIKYFMVHSDFIKNLTLDLEWTDSLLPGHIVPPSEVAHSSLPPIQTPNPITEHIVHGETNEKLSSPSFPTDPAEAQYPLIQTEMFTRKDKGKEREAAVEDVAGSNPDAVEEGSEEDIPLQNGLGKRPRPSQSFTLTSGAEDTLGERIREPPKKKIKLGQTTSPLPGRRTRNTTKLTESNVEAPPLPSRGSKRSLIPLPLPPPVVGLYRLLVEEAKEGGSCRSCTTRGWQCIVFYYRVSQYSRQRKQVGNPNHERLYSRVSCHQCYEHKLRCQWGPLFKPSVSATANEAPPAADEAEQFQVATLYSTTGALPGSPVIPGPSSLIVSHAPQTPVLRGQDIAISDVEDGQTQPPTTRLLDHLRGHLSTEVEAVSNSRPSGFKPVSDQGKNENEMIPVDEDKEPQLAGTPSRPSLCTSIGVCSSPGPVSQKSSDLKVEMDRYHHDNRHSLDSNSHEFDRVEVPYPFTLSAPEDSLRSLGRSMKELQSKQSALSAILVTRETFDHQISEVGRRLQLVEVKDTVIPQQYRDFISESLSDIKDDLMKSFKAAQEVLEKSIDSKIALNVIDAHERQALTIRSIAKEEVATQFSSLQTQFADMGESHKQQIEAKWQRLDKLDSQQQDMSQTFQKDISQIKEYVEGNHREVQALTGRVDYIQECYMTASHAGVLQDHVKRLQNSQHYFFEAQSKQIHEVLNQISDQHSLIMQLIGDGPYRMPPTQALLGRVKCSERTTMFKGRPCVRLPRRRYGSMPPESLDPRRRYGSMPPESLDPRKEMLTPVPENDMDAPLITPAMDAPLITSAVDAPLITPAVDAPSIIPVIVSDMSISGDESHMQSPRNAHEAEDMMQYVNFSQPEGTSDK